MVQYKILKKAIYLAQNIIEYLDIKYKDQGCITKD